MRQIRSSSGRKAAARAAGVRCDRSPGSPSTALPLLDLVERPRGDARSIRHLGDLVTWRWGGHRQMGPAGAVAARPPAFPGGRRGEGAHLLDHPKHRRLVDPGPTALAQPGYGAAMFPERD